MRRFPHIEKKIGKVHPSVTDRNPPASVAFKIFPFWIGASLNHVRPNDVGFGIGVAMGYASGLVVVPAKTSARLCVSSNQTVSANDNFRTAKTLTQKSSVFSSAFEDFNSRPRNNFQSFKCASDDGFFNRHNDGNDIVVLSGGCPAPTEHPLRFCQNVLCGTI